MKLNDTGRPVDDVIADLEAKRENDVKWQDGKAFGMIYDGGPSVHEVAEKAARLYLHENALNTMAFPSLGQKQTRLPRHQDYLVAGPSILLGDRRDHQS